MSSVFFVTTKVKWLFFIVNIDRIYVNAIINANCE